MKKKRPDSVIDKLKKISKKHIESDKEYKRKVEPENKDSAPPEDTATEQQGGIFSHYLGELSSILHSRAVFPVLNIMLFGTVLYLGNVSFHNLEKPEHKKLISVTPTSVVLEKRETFDDTAWFRLNNGIFLIGENVSRYGSEEELKRYKLLLGTKLSREEFNRVRYYTITTPKQSFTVKANVNTVKSDLALESLSHCAADGCTVGLSMEFPKEYLETGTYSIQYFDINKEKIGGTYESIFDREIKQTDQRYFDYSIEPMGSGQLKVTPTQPGDYKYIRIEIAYPDRSGKIIREQTILPGQWNIPVELRYPTQASGFKVYVTPMSELINDKFSGKHIVIGDYPGINLP